MYIPKFIQYIVNLDLSQNLYLVGGTVRDLLMGYTLNDYDLLCDDNAIKLAEYLEQIKYAKIKSIHEEFGTAKIFIEAENQILDIATCREESYLAPAELPKTKYPTDINIDLRRRDFTINAIAFDLKKNELIDPLNGLIDIQNKIIKVLHNKSYLEDPTRIIRAIRFSIRFNFEIYKSDLNLIHNALQDDRVQNLISKIRGLRVGIELKRLLECDNWLKGLICFYELGGFCIFRNNLNNLNFTKPKYNINTWECRFAWCLIKEPLIEEIMQNLEIKVNIQKKIKYIKNILNLTQIKPSLNFIREFLTLEEDYQNLLFSLKPQLKTLFLRMEAAIPTIKPIELKEMGFEGKQISDELERIFQLNLQTSSNTDKNQHKLSQIVHGFSDE